MPLNVPSISLIRQKQFHCPRLPRQCVFHALSLLNGTFILDDDNWRLAIDDWRLTIDDRRMNNEGFTYGSSWTHFYPHPVYVCVLKCGHEYHISIIVLMNTVICLVSVHIYRSSWKTNELQSSPNFPCCTQNKICVVVLIILYAKPN